MMDTPAPTLEKPAALPSLTNDPARAASDLAEFGYCLVADALSPAETAAVRQRVEEVAAEEKAAGLAFEDGGPNQQWGDFKEGDGRSRRDLFRAEAGGVNQRIWMLVNKGQVFVDLLEREPAFGLVRSFLGKEILLSSHSVNIAKPGGVDMPLHTDQWWMPAPVLPGEGMKVGDITRQNVPEPPATRPQAIAPAACANIMWMLTDFTAECGGTRLVPGSHLSGGPPSAAAQAGEGVIAAEAPAGTAMVFDGRIWHGTGANRTRSDRIGLLTTICGPQFRPQENYTIGVAPEVYAKASDAVRALLGLKVWGAYGRTGDPTDEFVTPPHCAG